MSILKPLRLILDSSTLIGLASCVKLAELSTMEIAEMFGENFICPVLSISQIHEAISLQDSEALDAILETFRQVPLTYWIKAAKAQAAVEGSQFFGSHLDLIFAEVQHQLGSAPVDAAAIQEQLWGKVMEAQCGIPVGSKDWFLALASAYELQKSHAHKTSVAEQTAALHGMGKEFRISDAQSTEIQSAKDFEDRVEDFVGSIVGPGDTRLTPTGHTMKDMAKTLQDLAHENPPESTDLFSWLCDCLGLNPKEFKSGAPFSRIAERWHFQNAIQLVCEQRDKKIAPEELSTLQPEALPTYWLQQGLRRIQLRAHSSGKGSDLGDSEIAAQSLYADYIIVDKRTKEHLKQLLSSGPIARSLLATPLCYSSFPELLKDLPNIAADS